MKTILTGLMLLLCANAFASVEDCKHIASFKENQQAKLSLSRFGLGLITSKQLDAEQKAQREKMFAEWKRCEAAK